MTAPALLLPEEPRALKRMARTLLDQAPETGLPLVVAGDWIADPLWEGWGKMLTERGMGREHFGGIVGEYGNELRLWVVGERPWDQCVSGLAGRVTRRLAPVAASAAERDQQAPWQTALHRVSVTPDDAMPSLISRISELHLLFDVAAEESQTESPPGPNGAFAIVWAGARPRDPEVPFGEGRSGTASSALAEALGRFLLKDPAYPPHLAGG